MRWEIITTEKFFQIAPKAQKIRRVEVFISAYRNLKPKVFVKVKT